jgi:signal transduction histidine kinase
MCISPGQFANKSGIAWYQGVLTADVTVIPEQRALRAAAERVARSSARLHRQQAGQEETDPGQHAECVVRLLTEPAARNAVPADCVRWITREDVDELRADFLRTIDPAEPVDSDALLTILIGLERLGERDSRGGAGMAGRAGEPDPVTAVTEVAHDMRSPLTSVLFLIDTILKRQSGPLTVVQERQLKLCYAAAWGLSALACDVIDAVRGHRLLDGRPTPFSITEVIQSVCDIARPIAEEKGLIIHAAMPAADGRLGYSSALARVLLNLASNALRYTDEGSVTIGCTELAATLVLFWVEDTGRGMPEEDGLRPSDAERDSGSGIGPYFSSTGLGLAICRNLLGAMGSALAFERTPSGGTKFSFELELPMA